MSLSQGVIDIINGWTSVDQGKANVDKTQAETQTRLLQNIQLQQKAGIDQRTAELLQGAALEPPKDPKDKSQEMTTNEDGSMVPTNTSNPFAQGVKAAAKQVESLTQLANIAQQAGNVAGFEKANEDLTKARQEMRQQQMEMVKFQTGINKEAAQTFGSVETIDDVKQAINWVRDNISPQAAEAVSRQIAQSIPDLDKATPAQIKTAIAPIANRFAAMGDQFRRKEAEQASKDREATRIETKARDDQNKLNQDRSAVLARDRLNLEEKKASDVESHRAARETRLTAISSKPATAVMKASARDVIKSDPAFKDAPMGGTLDAFAADVADRANKIRADAARGGEDMGLDEARQQALDELRPFVKKEMVGESHFAGMTFGGEQRSAYRRPGGAKAGEEGGTTPPAAGKKAESGGFDMKMAKAVTESGATYEPDKYDYRVVDGKVQRKLKEKATAP
jgi:hypothetical protein